MSGRPRERKVIKEKFSFKKPRKQTPGYLSGALKMQNEQIYPKSNSEIPTQSVPPKKRKIENIESFDFDYSHDVDQDGICKKCGIEDPGNQICSSGPEFQVIKKTSTGWLQRREELELDKAVNSILPSSHSDEGRKHDENMMVTSDQTSPLACSSSVSSSSRMPSESIFQSPETQNQDDEIADCDETAPDDEQSKFRQSTVRGYDTYDPSLPSFLDPVFIPARNATSADSEMWYLKSDAIYKIPAGQSATVNTTGFLVDYISKFPHVCRIEGISPNNHWLGERIDANLTVRSGIINPQHSGFFNVCVFNKGARELTIKAGSPIAVLMRENYLQ